MTTKKNLLRFLPWAALVVLLALGPLTTALYVKRGDSIVDEAVYVVIPHPDDEFQAWSLIEGKSNQYKVFVTLTRGEATRFCEPENFDEALQGEKGELPPDPTPQGKGTDTCSQARLSSLLGFLTQMSQSDTTIPGTFDGGTTYATSLAKGGDPCREEEAGGGGDVCGSRNYVEVWLDKEGRGAVVAFDLGDGNLTKEIAQGAVEIVLQQGHGWGLLVPGQSPALIGGFSNYDSDRCYRYKHGDHYAVEKALYEVNYGVGPQLGATCFRDPRRSLTAIVSGEAVDAAFEVGEDGGRIGAHGVHYGWLHADAYPIARWRQSSLFHRIQSFWVRFG